MKILFGSCIRVRLWKYLNNSKEQHENCIVVAGHRKEEWDEISGNYEVRWNQSPDATESPHMSAAVPMFWSDSTVQLGRYSYHLMAGLISYWTSYWQQRWGVKICFSQQREYRILTSRGLFSSECNFLLTSESAFSRRHFLHFPLAKLPKTNTLQLELRNVWTFKYSFPE